MPNCVNWFSKYYFSTLRETLQLCGKNFQRMSQSFADVFFLYWHLENPIVKHIQIRWRKHTITN